MGAAQRLLTPHPSPWLGGAVTSLHPGILAFILALGACLPNVATAQEKDPKKEAPTGSSDAPQASEKGGAAEKGEAADEGSADTVASEPVASEPATKSDEASSESEPATKSDEESGKSDEGSGDPGRLARRKAQDAEARSKQAAKRGEKLVSARLASVAKTWLLVAQDQKKAASLEAEAAQIERRTLDIEAKARRARSLLEQTQARRARALARLQELGLNDESVEGAADSKSDESTPNDEKSDGKKSEKSEKKKSDEKQGDSK